MRQFRNFALAFVAVIVMAQLVAASTASVTWIFSNGEIVDAGKFNTNFTNILNTINGNLDSDNITNGSLKEIDFGTEIITELSLKDNEISAALKDDAVLTGKIKDLEVKTADLDNLAATTGKIAVNAATATYKVSEGTMAGGVCTAPITMDVTGTRPATNAVLTQDITAGSTDERIRVEVQAVVRCTGSCTTGNPAVSISCNYNATDDAFVNQYSAANIAKASGESVVANYSNLYTPPDTSLHPVFCTIWDAGSSSATYTYCARMIVEHIKR